MHRLCNVDKQIAINGMMWIIRVLKIVSNIEITSYNKNIIDIYFSILEIL